MVDEQPGHGDAEQLRHPPGQRQAGAICGGLACVDPLPPRAEPPSYLAGGKIPKVDRVEWLIMPDSATEVAALQKGELDIYETPPLDLLPLLQARPDIVVAVQRKYGAIGFMRPDFKPPPSHKQEQLSH